MNLSYKLTIVGKDMLCCTSLPNLSIQTTFAINNGNCLRTLSIRELANGKYELLLMAGLPHSRPGAPSSTLDRNNLLHNALVNGGFHKHHAK